MKKIFFISIFLFFLITHKNVHAADLNVVCDDFGCTPQTSSSFFSTNLWFPLKTEIKTIHLRNNSTNPQLIGLSVTNGTTGSDDLSNVMTIKITDNYLNNLYDNSLANFYTLTEYPLIFLADSEHEVTFSFKVSMNDVKNDWQEKNTSFDMTLGFVVILTQTPTPGQTNTSEPNPTNTPGSNSTATATPPTFLSFEYAGDLINVPVLGTQTSIVPTPTKTIKEKIFGATAKRGETLGACSNPWWWWVLFIIQFIIEGLILKKASAEVKKRIIFAEFVSAIIFGLIFWKYFCSLIYVIISIIISLLFLFFSLLQSCAKIT